MKKLVFEDEIGEVKITKPLKEVKFNYSEGGGGYWNIYPVCKFCGEIIKENTGFRGSKKLELEYSEFSKYDGKVINGFADDRLFGGYKIESYREATILRNEEKKKKEDYADICDDCVKQLYKKLTSK